MKALVVDDSKTMRALLRRALAEQGFGEVREACNGREALQSLEKDGAPDLLVLDWNMPVMNGYETLCAVRSNPAFTSLRVVMVTTECEPVQVLRALQAGADEYLMKPFTRDALQSKLQLIGVG